MAISLNTNLHHPSLSCATKLYSGLKLQSPCLFATGRPNLTADFFSRISESLQCGTRNSKPARSRVGMMPIGTPRVPHRVPGEGTWQWVDLWNALLTPSLAIYDTMKSLKSPVGTHCVGYAYNLAGFLLAAGEKGNPFAMPLSRVALQSPAGAACGQADDIRNEANELLRIRDYLFNELAINTDQSVKKINKDLSRMKRFNAQEALEYGLIDRIVRPPRIKADTPRKDAGAGLG
ncbi:ATP-dependent Clp protease proteolytic subunit-related 2, chloroplastic-like protein [Gossypium australe]|uniref:ATP-dependent Clp protease proteolytic subunit n=1 Tax=Gossypium australe TaxID=47621 RepID=A0A5B6VIY7_9ROSI|nr:ATP-dependent Clp protease proteolytic subunit-related 2, chloroplastic-like protein [Gossypium australe]